jgi:hypothetical protein
MKTGICHVCGKLGPLSFEHIPPKSAGNSHEKRMYSGLEAAKRNLQGSGKVDDLNYVPHFDHFYLSVGAEILHRGFSKVDRSVNFKTANIKPLAFFKQVISNFCSELRAGEMTDCEDFLLDRESTDLPSHYRMRMYVLGDLRANYVMTPWMIPVYSSGHGPVKRMASIGIPPFGFTLFQMNDGGELDARGDITMLSKVAWADSPDIAFSLPFVQPEDAPNPLSWHKSLQMQS